MNDMIIRAAQDPSCILAVTPDRGGSWWSRLRPPTPRDFKEERMTFTDSYTAQDGIGADNFTLSVDFTLLRDDFQGEINIGCLRCAYYNYTKGYQPSVRILKSDGTTEAFYPVGTSHILENVAGIKVIKVGQNVRMVVYASDGSTVKDHTKPLPDGATVTSLSGATSYPGNIFAASIRNDTTGETVWQASHDELYETNNPWPSDVPRNFDDVTAAWYDAVAVGYAAIGDHDCEFEISYKNNVDYPGTIFYSNSQAGSINLHQIENNQNYFSSFRAFDEQDPSLRIPIDAGVQNAGSHIVKFKRQNGTAEAWVDGVLVKSVTSKRGNKPLYADNVPASHFDGNIFYIRLTDLTTGKTVWSYPSEAERVRLLTKTNVRTDRGVFEAASPDRKWRVDTQLRWGNLNSATIIVRATVDDYPETVFSFGLPTNPNYSAILLRRSSENQLYASLLGTRADGTSVYKTITADFSPDAGREYCFVLVFDTDGDFMSLYVDGNLLSSIALLPLVTIAVDSQTLPGFVLGTTSSSDAINSGTAVSSALVFDRALTAAEIAAFGVRRPRNFAEKTMTWTDAKTALDTIDQSHDFTFEIEFKCVKTNAAYVFASDGLRDFIRVFMSNGTVIVNTALLGTSSGGSTQFSAGSDLTNRHVLTVKFTGNTITVSVDSEVVYTRENLFRNVIEIGTPRSNAGYVHKISVTDDTTGETVWRANHNDLFTY